MTMLGKAAILGKPAILAAAALGLPFVTGDMEPGVPKQVVPVSERVQSGFCRMIAEAGPNDVGKCNWATGGWARSAER